MFTFKFSTISICLGNFVNCKRSALNSLPSDSTWAPPLDPIRLWVANGNSTFQSTPPPLVADIKNEQYNNKTKLTYKNSAVEQWTGDETFHQKLQKKSYS